MSSQGLEAGVLFVRVKQQRLALKAWGQGRYW